MASSGNFAATPRNSRAILAVNTTTDGSGSPAPQAIFPAGANGSRIERITIQATVSTTSGMVRLFVYDGTIYAPFHELEVQAITASATVRAWKGLVLFGAGAYSHSPGSTGTIVMIPGPGLLLPNGYSLRGTTHNNQNIVAIAEGGDF